MKFMLVLCLLGMAMDATTASGQTSICTVGLTTYNAFRQCVEQYLPDKSSMLQNPSRNTINNYLGQICGQTLDNARQCFESKLSVCDEATRSKLTAMARTTGVFCNNGGPEIDHSTIYMVAFVEWSGLNDRSCPKPNTDICFDEALGAMMVDDNEYTRLSKLTMEQLSAPLANYFRADMSCIVRLHRESADRCTGWRAQALADIFQRAAFQPLGVTMPFNIKELDEMFEF